MAGQSRRLVAVGGVVCVLLGLVALAVVSGRGDSTDDAVAQGPSSASWLARVTTAPTTPAGLVGAWTSEVGGRDQLEGFGEVSATVTAADGTETRLCLLAALTAAQRAAGLMFVTDATLGGHDGMVFVFDEDVSSGFWMRNTRLPLSIAYFDADGVLVSVADMDPCPDSAPTCPSYAAGGPFRYAVEVPQGNLARVGVEGPGGAAPGPRDAALELVGPSCPAA